MLFRKITVLMSIFIIVIFFGCGRSVDKTASENQSIKNDEQVTRVIGKERSVEIQCSGMTCEGCKSSIEKKVKRVNGIKDVNADYKTNKVVATFDDGKTNIDAIKNAIISAGYKVESVKE